MECFGETHQRQKKYVMECVENLLRGPFKMNQTNKKMMPKEVFFKAHSSLAIYCIDSENTD